MTASRGSLATPDFRMFIRNSDGLPVSPFHDIPMYSDEAGKVFNMVVEVPRWTNAKMEVSLDEPLNPIKQDENKGKLRYVANCFPHRGYIWNYGAISQTWEDPEHVDEATECKGDGDPVDVCEIGHKIHPMGSVVEVKILGTIALIDEGETDWKMLAIDVTDPLAEKINDIADIEEEMPGFLDATVEWFRVYKMPDGKPPNEFAFDGEPKDREFALRILEECHQQWVKMMENGAEEEDGGLSKACTVFDAPSKIEPSDAEAAIDATAHPEDPFVVDSIVDKWHYIDA